MFLFYGMVCPITKLNIVWLVIYNFYGVLFFCCFVVELAVTKTIDEGRGRNITEAWLIIASAWTSNWCQMASLTPLYTFLAHAIFLSEFLCRSELITKNEGSYNARSRACIGLSKLYYWLHGTILLDWVTVTKIKSTKTHFGGFLWLSTKISMIPKLPTIQQQ